MAVVLRVDSVEDAELIERTLRTASCGEVIPPDDARQVYELADAFKTGIAQART
jgi:hypothetical protein